MPNITFHKLSWTDLHKDCLNLYQSKLKAIEVDQIVSICRGGDIVSRIFSDLLDNLPISHITLTSYEDIKKLKVPVITEEPRNDLTNKRILIIDEVSDTGASFDIAITYFKDKRHVKELFTLAPYIKPGTKYVPDFYQKSIDSWIVFPYEIRETAEGFEKMLGGSRHTREKMLEIGFKEWEVDSVTKSAS
ncbi:hypothetical protein KBD81_00575 [Candidatus Woesebacteria bacterium]|nr:hypothetical protein [Candidatus Woesebacteria bacterium]